MNTEETLAEAACNRRLTELSVATCGIWPHVRVHFSLSPLCNCHLHSALSDVANHLTPVHKQGMATISV